MMMIKNKQASPLLSCNNLKSGKKLSISKTDAQTAIMAIKDAIKPFITAR